MKTAADAEEKPTRASNWKTFSALMLGVLVLALVQVPYAASVMAQQLTGRDQSLWLWIGVNTLLVPLILAAIATAVGLQLGDQVGLGAPLLRALLTGEKGAAARFRALILPSILAGLTMLAVNVLLSLTIFRLPADVAASVPQTLARPPAWAGVLGSVYAGFFEEVLLRLGFLTLLVWIGAKLIRARQVGPGLFWTANALAALMFGVGHLPSVAIFTTITPFLLVRTLVLNGIGGLIFGWLYWRKGLLGAIVGHGAADIVQFVVLPLLKGG